MDVHDAATNTGITTINNWIQRRYPFHRLRKRILRLQPFPRQKQQSTESTTNHRMKHYGVGTRLTFSRPTTKRFIEWYNTKEGKDYGNIIPPSYLPPRRRRRRRGATADITSTTASTTTASTSNMVNHLWAGMTNPTIQYHYPKITTDESMSTSQERRPQHMKKKEEEEGQSNDDDDDMVIVAVSTTTRTPPTICPKNDNAMDPDNDEEKEKWWPPVSSLLQQQQLSSSKQQRRLQRKRQQCNWRVLQYRQTVGCGYDCYLTCRDAILQWEFHNNNQNNNPSLYTQLSNNNNVIDSKRKGISKRRRFPITFTLHREQGIVVLPTTTPSVIIKSNEHYIRPRRHSSDTTTSGWASSSISSTDSTATTTKISTNNNNDMEPYSTTTQQISWGPGQRMLTYTSTPTLSLRSSLSSDPKILHVINRYLLHRLPKLYVINPVTVLYNVVDQCGVVGGGSVSDVGTTPSQKCNSITTTTPPASSSSSTPASSTTYTSTAYGTGLGHWLCGEERVTVCYRHPTTTTKHDHHNEGCVDIEIISYSQPNSSSVMGRMVYPIIRPLQESFFISQMIYLQNVAENVKQ